MRSIVDNILPVFIFLFVLLIFIATSWITYYFKKKSKLKGKETRSTSALLVGVLSGFYSIFLGFIIYLLWNDYQDARITVIDETTKLYILAESSQDFPPAIQTQINNELVNYISIVINEEWASMRLGKESPGAHEAIDRVYSKLQQYRPSNGSALLFYDKALNSLNSAIEDRSHRINLLNLVIPTEWYIIIFTGALSIVVMSIFSLKENAINLLMHWLLCFFLAFYITAVIVLSYSFSGAVSVSDAPFKKLLIDIQKPDT